MTLLRIPTDKLVTACSIMKIWRLRFKRMYNMPKTKRLLNLIEENEFPTVQDLADATGGSHSITSQDLKLLRDVGLVDFESSGKYHGFFINKSIVDNTLILADVMRALEGGNCRNPEHEDTITTVLAALGHTNVIKWSSLALGETRKEEVTRRKLKLGGRRKYQNKRR